MVEGGCVGDGQLTAHLSPFEANGFVHKQLPDASRIEASTRKTLLGQTDDWSTR
jgi:hypothetical protein